MSRRLSALVVLVLVFAPAAAQDSWVGKKVFPKSPDLKMKLDGLEVDPFAGAIPGIVEGVDGDWVAVRSGDKSNYIKRSEVVRLEDAVAYFTDYIQRYPRSTWGYHTRGAAWHEKGEHDIAIQDYNEAIRLDPKYAPAYNNRGNAWYDKKEYDKAIADYKEAIRLDPSSPSYNNRGIAWNAKKEYDKAIADCNEAIRLDPKYALAFHNRAIAWENRKEYDKAIVDYNEAIRLDPKDALAHSNRGNAWRAKKEYDKAIVDYTEAIRLDPKDALAHYNRGRAWNDKKEFDKAIADYTEAIRLDPKDASAYNSRGIAWRAKKDYDKAIADYTEAIRLNPKNARTHNNRGNAWRTKTEYDKAIADYTEAIRLDPKYALAHFSRSVAQMLMRRPEAAAGFQAVLDLEAWKGDRSPHAVIVGHLAARQAGDEAAAKRFLEDSAGKLNEAWPYPVVQFLRGDIDEAALLKLATDDDKRAEARCYLGMDHAIKGRKDEALAHFRWVKEHGTATFMEHDVALAELDRLERWGKP
jgi:tetratricopeptide (TPR) repeat protein